MIQGKSLLHVIQDEGKNYSFSSIKGYYNDLTNKVIQDEKNYSKVAVITSSDEKQKEFYFPIAIFQYGLGAYDLYLNGTDSDLMKKKFLSQLTWAIENQQPDGSWKNFDFISPEAPYSAMAQGEGCSLLIRGYALLKDKKYLEAARKAIDFMLISVSNGGTTLYKEDEIVLLEFTNARYVYNGWIFAIFGLIDYCVATNDEKYKNILDKCINSFIEHVNEMDNGYWSLYCFGNTIASPFYHHLHISLLTVLYKFTNNDRILGVLNNFRKYEMSKKNKRRAFIKKSIQKVFEKNG